MTTVLLNVVIAFTEHVFDASVPTDVFPDTDRLALRIPVSNVVWFWNVLAAGTVNVFELLLPNVQFPVTVAVKNVAVDDAKKGQFITQLFGIDVSSTNVPVLTSKLCLFAEKTTLFL